MASLKRENISDKLVDIIAKKVIRNEWKSGDPIYESRLSQEYGISRSPVRDALHQLKRLRLVEQTEKGSYRVTELTVPFVQQLYDTVNLFYQYAFSEAAKKATPANLAEMRRLLTRLEASIDEDDFELYLANVSRFAEKILQVAGNRVIEQMALELMPTAERAQWASITYLPEQLRKAVSHLTEGYEMIAAGKPKAAASAFETFAFTHKALILEQLSGKGKTP